MAVAFTVEPLRRPTPSRRRRFATCILDVVASTRSLTLGDRAGAPARPGRSLQLGCDLGSSRRPTRLGLHLVQVGGSFYDRLHREGAHEICVCTQHLLRAGRAGQHCAVAGIKVGETDRGRGRHLRTVECDGGCGWGPVVSVDQRYRRAGRLEAGSLGSWPACAEGACVDAHLGPRPAGSSSTSRATAVILMSASRRATMTAQEAVEMNSAQLPSLVWPAGAWCGRLPDRAQGSCSCRRIAKLLTCAWKRRPNRSPAHSRTARSSSTQPARADRVCIHELWDRRHVRPFLSTFSLWSARVEVLRALEECSRGYVGLSGSACLGNNATGSATRRRRLHLWRGDRAVLSPRERGQPRSKRCSRRSRL